MPGVEKRFRFEMLDCEAELENHEYRIFEKVFFLRLRRNLIHFLVKE